MVPLFLLLTSVLVVMVMYFATKKPKLTLSTVEKMAEEARNSGKNVGEGLFWVLRGANALDAEITAYDELRTEMAAKSNKAATARDSAAKTLKEAETTAEELRKKAKEVEVGGATIAKDLVKTAEVAEGRTKELAELEKVLA